MKILAIDTSGLQAGAAIVSTSSPCAMDSPYICVGEIFLNARTGVNSYTHSEILMPAVEQLFKLTRLEPLDINYVAYTNGPGSFTGLRIGASCALAIAHALCKPAIAVPTLDALAYNMLNAGEEATIVPMLDARRGQVYTAVYKRDGEGKITREKDVLALPVEEFLPTVCSDRIIFLGDGADANRETIKTALPHAIFASPNNNRQRAASAGICAAEKITSGKDISEEIKILYVRAPQAIREREKICIQS